MPAHFDLVVTADYPSRTAELRLLDAHGSQLAFRQTDFKNIAVSRQQGLFDLRNYLRYYVEEGKEAASVAEIGVCIAEQVLGEEIFRKLWKSESQRTLRIQLPGATEEENHLAAALARVPWEMARAAANQPTLGERNLLVRVVHDMAAPDTQPLELGKDECLRVLFVLAEARGSRPLAARLERRMLRRLFEKEIYPNRRIVAHFLTHGVTRERLQAQIQENGGYHIVHWSGHGHLNLLEIAKPGGAKDHLSGEELLDLFIKAGGFLPRLCFLSACHSGDILRVKDWKDFLAVAEGKEPGTKNAPASETPGSETKDIALDVEPGYTGTAHALLQGGVSSVVAMRHAVGDDYARDLGVEFYRALLAHAQPKTAAAALTMARQSLLDATKPNFARYAVCDHATPVLYGAEQPHLSLRNGRSPALDTRNPRLHAIAELTAAGHEHFVGRTWELAGLGADFIGSATGAEVKPVAVITGLGGMGKTALTAEALGLWDSRFEWVLLYQAQPNALGFDATLRDIHLKLNAELGRYHDHVKSRPADAIYRAADAELTGPERLDRLTRNLVRALRDEAILLVLDNFETNLKPPSETGAAGEPLWACQDPAWDRCLSRLATELVGTPSRVLITSRRPLAALPRTTYHGVPLGPLPSGEAALYLREHAGLRRMVFSGDEAEKALALRLLNASRFHPLLMDRLARLATGEPPLRPQLMQALTALESRHDHAQIPALFASVPEDPKELTYLQDALATSLDQLIRDAGPDARRLLWMIAVANDPVDLGLLKGMWSGESHKLEQLRQMKQILDRLPQLPQELQAKLKAIPPELRAQLDALASAAPARPDPAPLLRYLDAVGLVTEGRTGPDDANPDLTCHELVRERIRAWMRDHPRDRAGLAENTIRLAYADRLEAAFKGLRHQDMTAALDAGSRALVYCVQAAAWERLGDFTSQLVTTTGDPRLLAELLPHLELAAESAPAGRPRWCCLTSLADALRNAGRPDASLPFYEQGATQARAAAESGGEMARQASEDVAVITGNWAGALMGNGELDNARQRHLESAEAAKKAGSAAAHVIRSELGALQIDIRQGRAAQALPEVEARLAQVESWWRQHRAGQRVPEAPDAEMLARGIISALNIAVQAHFAHEDWEPALRRTDAVLEVKRALERPVEDIAIDRVNRAVVLMKLGRYPEAKAELEDCLQVFHNDPPMRAKVLSSFADLFDKQGDVGQAITQERRALALREVLPDPQDRAISHNNLANCLERSGMPSAVAESPRHQLAALVYQLVAGLGQDLQTMLRNYAVDFRRARDAGTALCVPRVAELLADPAFRPLDDWLRQRQADVGELPAAVDRFLDLARQSVLNQD
ncbi:MAG: CHAT domain-containing protein [Candidatus Limnocylindria bacterium]